MKVRSLDELSDYLANELKTRKKELISLAQMIRAAREHESPRLRRAAFLLVYAHWEGFVKAAGRAYLEYVRAQRLQYSQLTANFVAVALKTRLELFGESHKVTVLTSIVEEFMQRMGDTAEFHWAGEIDCRSNLNSVALKEVLCLLGIDHAAYATKEQFLDRSLLATRNDLAHGELRGVDKDSYDEAERTVIELMDRLKTDIENAAALSTFRRV